MESMVCRGLVIRQSNYGEADRILTIFTGELGIVRVVAKGVRKYKSHQGAAAQLLCFGQFTLCRGKNLYTLRGAAQTESFYRIGASAEKLALAAYLCELTQGFVAEGVCEPEILRLLLNTLYILADKDRPLQLIKAVYELRLSALAGFAAQSGKCVCCGTDTGLVYFSARQGGVLCGACLDADRGARKISDAARFALDYILCQPPERIFAFEASQGVLFELYALAEDFVCAHVEKAILSLSYFKNLL